MSFGGGEFPRRRSGRELAVPPRGGELSTIRRTDIVTRPRPLHEVTRAAKRMDVVGGDPDSVSRVLAQGVLPHLQRDQDFSTFVLDIGEVPVSGRLAEATANTGHGVADWQVSPGELIKLYNPGQIAEILAESMPAEQNSPRPNRSVEKRILANICKALAEKDGDRTVPPTLAQIREAIDVLRNVEGLEEESTLTRDQRKKVKRLYPDDVNRQNGEELKRLEAHVGALVDNDGGQAPVVANSDQPMQLFTFHVHDRGVDPTAQINMLVQGLMQTVATQAPREKPNIFVLTSAEKLDSQLRKRLAGICQEHGVQAIFVFDKVDEETAKDIGREGSLASLRVPNALEARNVAEVIGQERTWQQTGQSSNRSTSENVDRGSSVNKKGTLGILPESRGSSTSRSRNTSTSEDKSYSLDDRYVVPPEVLQGLRPTELLFVDANGAVMKIPFGGLVGGQGSQEGPKSSPARTPSVGADIPLEEDVLIVDRIAARLAGWRRGRSKDKE